MSNQWYQQHIKDPFVKQANKEGARSRAAYKLLEIQKKRQIIQKGNTVIDLGSAPGAWSEALLKIVGHQGTVVACDLLPMAPIQGVSFVQGNFLEVATQQLLTKIATQYHVIVSDMAPNLTGNRLLDQSNMEKLIQMILSFSDQYLEKEGKVVAKGFHGEMFEEMLLLFKKRFKCVKVFKPEASKQASREIYFIGEGFGV